MFVIDFNVCESICEQSVDTQWQKVSLLLEFGEWLYCRNFPRADGQHQVQWAVDILLHMETQQADGAGRTHWIILFIGSWHNCVNDY